MRKESFGRNRLSALDVVLFVILTLLGLAIILPVYNAIMISFVTEAEYFRSPFILFPKDPTLEAYRTLLETGSILNGYGNTLYHIAVGLPISMFITFAMGYVLSRPEFPGRKLLYLFVLITMLFSGGMVPSFLLIRSLGLMNTRWSVILSCLLSTYYVVLVTNFIRALPASLLSHASGRRGETTSAAHRVTAVSDHRHLAVLCGGQVERVAELDAVHQPHGDTRCS
ncbi:MAG: carbohydrate ABC transporter permease [Merdibacter sp.]